ncbi:MAG TPA: hypothetical protein VJ553_06755 [Candidatus Paceibacterota bacterium]|nr:hypothetical protein [Candidatus Paceibacterota bacterium]
MAFFPFAVAGIHIADLVDTIAQCKEGGRFILGPNGYRDAMRAALREAGRYPEDAVGTAAGRG